MPFSVPMASQHWLFHVPSHSLANYSGALAPLPMSPCFWECFLTSVSLKHTHVLALLPSYDPNLASSSLSPHCDLKQVLCHHPHPVSSMTLLCVIQWTAARAFYKEPSTEPRPPRGMRTHLDIMLHLAPAVLEVYLCLFLSLALLAYSLVFLDRLNTCFVGHFISSPISVSALVLRNYTWNRRVTPRLESCLECPLLWNNPPLADDKPDHSRKPPLRGVGAGFSLPTLLHPLL